MPDLGKSFVSVLITDIIDARALLSSADSQVNRRHLVRATLAGVEGLAWYCREEVRDAARQMGQLTPLADMALREQVYTVSEHGKVLEQRRFLTLTTSIRLTIEQAKELAPGLHVEFGEEGWHKLRRGIEVRHRITHPKQSTDLVVSSSDLQTVSDGFEWHLAICTDMLTAVVAHLAMFARLSRDLLNQLKTGDPEALRLYHELLQAGDD